MMSIQSGVGIMKNNSNSTATATSLASFSASQIFGGCHHRNILLKKTNYTSTAAITHRKITLFSNVYDGERRPNTNVVCPKAVSDSSYSQTCLDPDASNVYMHPLSLSLYIYIYIISHIHTQSEMKMDTLSGSIN